MKSFFSSVAPAFFFAFASIVAAQDVTLVPGPSQQSGKYRVSLRLPEGGLVAGEEQQIELRLVDTSRDDPVLGPAAVIRAAVHSTVAMPAMPSMPRVEEIAHPEGIPGDYGLHPSFAHGGDFLLTLRITPPGDQPFTVEFQLKIGDEVARRKPVTKPFHVELKTEPGKVKAGQATRLKATVWSNRETRDANGRPTGKRQLLQVSDFDTIHERKLHLIIVRKDLSYFTHQHPEIQSDGTFVLPNFVFPGAGDYQLFFDTAPKGFGAQVLSASVRVEGQPAPNAGTASTARAGAEQLVGDVTVSLKDERALLPRKTLPFPVRLRDSATKELIRDLQPYLGAMGHMIMIHEDAQTFVHAHPDERDPENGKRGEITFLARAPKPGAYRVWIEFQRRDKVNVAEFRIEVKDGALGEQAR